MYGIVISWSFRLSTMELGGSFDRVVLWLNGVEMVIVVDFHNDMVYNWKLQITIPFPIMAKFWPQGEDPTFLVEDPLPTSLHAYCDTT